MFEIFLYLTTYFSLWPILATTAIAMASAWLLLHCVHPSTDATNKISSIDGLRGALAIAVFLHHSSIWYFYLRTGQWVAPPSRLFTQLGQSSVVLFLMITSFVYWTRILDAGEKPMHWPKFYLSRLLRLGPLYFFVTLCLVLLALHAGGWRFQESIAAFSLHVFQWLSFTFFGTPSINGFSETSSLMGIAWTLRYTWLFYAALPLAACIVRPKKTLTSKQFETGAIPALCSLIVTGVLVRVAAFEPIILLSFCGGIIAAYVARIERIRRQLSSNVWSVAAIISLWVVASFENTAYCLPAIGLLTIAFTIIACGNSLFGLLGMPTARFLGAESYSIFLLHNFVLFTAFRLLLGSTAASLSETTYWMLICGLVPPIVLVCYGTFRFIEAPAIALPRRM